MKPFFKNFDKRGGGWIFCHLRPRTNVLQMYLKRQFIAVKPKFPTTIAYFPEEGSNFESIEASSIPSNGRQWMMAAMLLVHWWTLNTKFKQEASAGCTYCNIGLRSNKWDSSFDSNSGNWFLEYPSSPLTLLPVKIYKKRKLFFNLIPPLSWLLFLPHWMKNGSWRHLWIVIITTITISITCIFIVTIIWKAKMMSSLSSTLHHFWPLHHLH